MSETSFVQDIPQDTLPFDTHVMVDSMLQDTIPEIDSQIHTEKTIIIEPVLRNEIDRPKVVETWQISLIIILLLLLAWVQSSITGIIQSSFSFLVKKRMTEKNEGRSFVNNAKIIVATFSTFIAISIIAFEILDSQNRIDQNQSPIITYGLLVLICIVVEIVRICMTLFIGILTKSQNDSQKFILQRNSNLNISLFLLIPCASASLVTSGDNLRIVGYIALSIVILLLGIGLTKGIQTIKSKVFPIYYLILYICSLEIIPAIWGLYIVYATI